MTQDEIIEMAREADIDHHRLWNDDGTNRLEAFAKLVADKAIAELESQEPVIDKSAATRIATSLGWSPQRTEQLKACVYCGQLVIKENT